MGSNGKVESLECVRVEWTKDKSTGQFNMNEISKSTFHLKADLVLLAMGFTGPITDGILEQEEIGIDQRGNILANTSDYQTSIDGIFSAGDMRRGQSLVVWAIREGRQCARSVDKYLMGTSKLPT